MLTKPYSQACANNRQPILGCLQTVFTVPQTILEIGSGSGQHACYFAQHLPHLTWQPSDRSENLPGIQLWLDEVQLNNILPPIALDVVNQPWPMTALEGVFTANTLHIMAWPEVIGLFKQLQRYLLPGAYCYIYGPFNYGGQYTSASNAQFDQWLKSRDPLSAIRDFEAVVNLAQQAEMTLVNDFTMPANNRSLVFVKRG
jgi:hypothetical protein